MNTENNGYDDTSLENTEPMDESFPDKRELRDKFIGIIKSYGTWLKEQFDHETAKYIRAYRHEFGSLSKYISDNNKVDVNIVFPLVKNLITNLYYRDPKVYVRAEDPDKPVQIPVIQLNPETGAEEQVISPETGQPLFKEYNSGEAAKKLERKLNQNIKDAKLKYEAKSVLLDSHLTFYGAIKCGWGNDQGVASMGEGAPPSASEFINEGWAYGIRLKPWDVIPDMANFYKPEWIAVRHLVRPEQLKNDERLSIYRQNIKGVTHLDRNDRSTTLWKDIPEEDCKFVEYYELYLKPCAKYPRGLYMMLTDEVKEDPLYISEWPIESSKFPIKIIYFNPDPQGGLPVPDVRYYIGQQNAKLNLRNAAYEYVQRSMPMLVFNSSAIKNSETVIKQITSGQVPRVVSGTQIPNRVVGGVSFPAIPADLYNFDAISDNDVSRVTGLVAPVTPTSNSDNQLASALKLQASGEQIRQNERADIVTDFLQSIFEFWAEMWGQFSGIEEFKGKFKFEIKPFSMSYEDPVILRKQWVDLLNLSASPELRAALAQEGVTINFANMYKKILETYDERDTSSFITFNNTTPESQVLDALQENQMIMSGQGFGVQVLPTDNDKVHILIHQMLGDAGSEHIQAHAASMMAKQNGSTAGGGNPEGMPTNGVAANQDLYSQSASSSPVNQKIAINREAHDAGM